MVEPDKSDQPENPASLPDKTATSIPVRVENSEAENIDASEPIAQVGAVSEVPEDEAVEEIVRAEGDDALKAQDEAADAIVMKTSHWERFKNAWLAWWASPKKRWGTIGSIVLLLGLLFAIPYTRYNILGLFFQADVTVHVVDSQTGSAVSGATVAIDGKTAQTEGDGNAVLHVHSGSKTITVTKKYYQTYEHGELITLSAAKNKFKAPFIAQGRQVKVKVVNVVSGAAVAGVTIQVHGTSAKTDKTGVAVLVVPTDSSTQEATLTASGYNTTKVQLAATDDAAKNTFKITPAGKLYFLSNLSGKIDVVKTNLDGTSRQTVLAGTGTEDRNTTSLLASRDWKYLALLSRRSGDKASIYLIDTTNGDKLTTIDEGNAEFSLAGWSGDRFVYRVTRNTVQQWQPNRQALKSFDATTGQALLLDQTQSTGTDQSNYADQSFGTAYIFGDDIVYAKNWNGSYPNQTLMSGKQAELDTIGASGSGHKVIKSFSPTAGTPTNSVSIETALYEPEGLYVWFQDSSGDHFYDYEDEKIVPNATMTQEKFYATPYSTYLLSPSGSKTFWAEQRDGKNALFVGDADAKNQKQVASLSDYTTYGWYTDEYLLVSKKSSELYIMPVNGGTPLKITDYYKPAINYNGYGGGYGGL